MANTPTHEPLKSTKENLWIWVVSCVIFVGLTLAVSFGTSLPFRRYATLIGATSTNAVPPVRDESRSWPELKVVLASQYSPSVDAFRNRELLDYIGNKVHRRISLRTNVHYSEAMSLLANKETDIGIICSGSFAFLDRAEAVTLLAAPVMFGYGSPRYRAYIIVPKDSPASTFADLEGKRFAMTDPLSNTGTIYPSYRALQLESVPNRFFSSVLYTYSADKSIAAVANGFVDGASVDGLAWEYLDRTDPGSVMGTRILERSPWFGSPPIVVPKETDPALVQQLRQVLLAMDRDPEGAAILKKMLIDRFAVPNATAYDTVFEMIQALQKNGLPFNPKF